MSPKFEDVIFSQFPKLRDIPADDNLFEAGAITSVQFIAMVCCIEDTWGFDIDDEEIVKANFGTLDNIRTFIQAKLSG